MANLLNVRMSDKRLLFALHRQQEPGKHEIDRTLHSASLLQYQLDLLGLSRASD